MSARARKTRSAVTHYRVLREYGRLTLLQVRIETGRTHQIRVHMAEKGHPVVGDTVYGGGRERGLAGTLRAEAINLNRLFLHAHRLEFRHPRTGKALSFTSPLPQDLENFLQRL